MHSYTHHDHWHRTLTPHSFKSDLWSNTYNGLISNCTTHCVTTHFIVYHTCNYLHRMHSHRIHNYLRCILYNSVICHNSCRALVCANMLLFRPLCLNLYKVTAPFVCLNLLVPFRYQFSYNIGHRYLSYLHSYWNLWSGKKFCWALACSS